MRLSRYSVLGHFSTFQSGMPWGFHTIWWQVAQLEPSPRCIDHSPRIIFSQARSHGRAKVWRQNWTSCQAKSALRIGSDHAGKVACIPISLTFRGKADTRWARLVTYVTRSRVVMSESPIQMSWFALISQNVTFFALFWVALAWHFAHGGCVLGDRMYSCAVSAGPSNSNGFTIPHTLEQKFEPQIFSLFLCVRLFVQGMGTPLFPKNTSKLAAKVRNWHKIAMDQVLLYHA